MTRQTDGVETDGVETDGVETDSVETDTPAPVIEPGNPPLSSRAEPEDRTPSRRRVLGYAAVAGALGVVAACGGGGDDTANSGGSGSDSTSAPEPTDTGSADDGGGGGGGGGAGAALTTTADVPVKGGVILDGPKIVVTQPAKGDFKAFTAVCTHMSCTVGSVKNNVISCPCHGSTYSAADGTVKGGPAPNPLREIKIKVEGSNIVEA